MGINRPTLVPSEIQTGSGKAPTRRGGAVLYREPPTANDGAATVLATSSTLAVPLGTGAHMSPLEGLPRPMRHTALHSRRIGGTSDRLVALA